MERLNIHSHITAEMIALEAMLLTVLSRKNNKKKNHMHMHKLVARHKAFKLKYHIHLRKTHSVLTTKRCCSGAEATVGEAYLQGRRDGNKTIRQGHQREK